MIDQLLLILIVVSMIQPTRQARAAACTFVGMTVAFDMLPIPDAVYYFAAAATDGICILILSRMGKESGIIQELQLLCLMSIVLNFAGWFCYEMYLPTWPYKAAFIMFYIVVILSLIMRRIGDADGSTNTYRPWLPVGFTSLYLDNRSD